MTQGKDPEQMPMYIDAHTHPNIYAYKRFGISQKDLINDIEKTGIISIANSLDIASYRKNRILQSKCAYIFASFGIHPWKAPKYTAKLGKIEALIEKNELIGEIGLDRFFVSDRENYEAQVRIFSFFLSRCREKLISVHTKGAEREALEMLKRSGNSRVLIHWYSGDRDTLKEMISRDYYFTVGPEILVSEKIRSIAKTIPENRLLTETDNPGGPESIYGRTFMPDLVKRVVRVLAKIRSADRDELKNRIFNNFIEASADLSLCRKIKFLSPGKY